VTEAADDEQADPDEQHDLSDSAASLVKFSELQRKFVGEAFGANLSAFQASPGIKAIQEWATAQSAITEQFAKSMDFTALTGSLAKLTAQTSNPGALFAKEWVEHLNLSIDVPAITGATALVEQFSKFSVTPPLGDFAAVSKIVEQFKMPKINWTGLAAAFTDWLPDNLDRVTDLARAAQVALDDGLPLAWIPRTEIVTLILDAETREDRMQILDDRREDILDDCIAALEPIDHEWAIQCRSGVETLRAGFDAPAQSHAANILDSVVMGFLGGRLEVSHQAKKDLLEMSLRAAAENLTIRPLLRAFTRWFPSDPVDPPTHFARHPTAHAVGHVGVFTPRNALVAVMLAVSLTVQFAPANTSDESGGDT